MLLYQRYFLREFFKFFGLILVCFYGLYILIDYSSHASLFHQQRSSGWAILFYYGAEFIQRMGILIPFAVAIGTIKTLTTLNQHHEIAALLAAGIPLKNLLKPFLLVALGIGLLLNVSSEWISPKAQKQLRYFSEQRKQEKNQKAGITSVQLMPLLDESPLLYYTFDHQTQALQDVYWIRSLDQVTHMQQLFVLEKEPRGVQVDWLTRDPSGNLIPVNYAAEATFSDLFLSQKSVMEMTTLPNELSLTQLWQRLNPDHDILNEKEAQTRTTFYYKLALPWLSLLVVMGCMPFCIRFSRQQNLLYLYAGTLFGLIAFYLIMGAGLLLGERQTLSPALAIWPPVGALFAILGYRYWRLK